MTTIVRAALACCVMPLALFAAQSAEQLTTGQQAEFLRTARIVKAEPIGKGVTHPFRLTLSDGSITHDAAFQSVDQERKMSRTGRGGAMEFKFTDSWRFNIAAHRVATLVGIGYMVPVSVQRSWEGKTGALTWWVDNVLMDEQERKKTEAEPPDPAAWMYDQLRMRVFTQLVYDTDRNQGNILITKDWRVVMIDFTRAFRTWGELPEPVTILPRCDRTMLAAMRGLTKESVRKATGDYLSIFAVDALLARRNILVAHFDKLIAERGEQNVLY